MDPQLQQAYERSRWRSQGTKLQRTLKQPVRMVASKAMLLTARRFKLGIPLTVRTFWGDPMRVVYPDEVSWILFKYRIYDAAFTGFLLEHLKPGMTFFDVGAHFGYFSLLASRLVGEQGHVHSFEPTPSTYGILSRNVGARPNVTVNNIACWSSRTTITFNDFGTQRPAFNSAFDPRLEQSADAVQRDVPAMPLDDYVAESGAVPSIMKIDAESAELEIYRGMQQTLTTHRPIVVMEVGDFDIKGAPTSRELVDGMIATGYIAHELGAQGLTPHQPRERYEYDNIIFMPA